MVAVLTLALGIGANTAIFTVTYALLLKPLPYTNPDEIVLVNENNLSRGWPSFSVSPANFLDWRAQNTIVLQLAAYGTRTFNYAGGGTPERLRGCRARPDFWRSSTARRSTAAASGRMNSRPARTGRDPESRVLAARVRRPRSMHQQVDHAERTALHHRRRHARRGGLAGRDMSLFVPRAFTADELMAAGRPLSRRRSAG